MGTFKFEVEVETDIKIPLEDDRTELNFAASMLYTSSLRRAQDSDGWYDLKGHAWITSVTSLDDGSYIS